MLSPKIEHQDRSTFVWKHGVLGYGIPTALIGSGTYFVLRYGFDFSGPHIAGLLIHLGLGVLLVGLIGGYLWGALYWAITHRRKE